MKKGENVLCKKAYGDAYFKGKYYKISRISNNGEIFVFNEEYGAPWLFLPPNYNPVQKNGKWGSQYKDCEKFYDFFYSKKEIRKMKLKKLNKIKN